jgi:hypothetical protein
MKNEIEVKVRRNDCTQFSVYSRIFVSFTSLNFDALMWRVANILTWAFILAPRTSVKLIKIIYFYYLTFGHDGECLN